MNVFLNLDIRKLLYLLIQSYQKTLINMSAPDAEYQPVDAGAEGPNGADTTQDDYKSRTGQSAVPVVSDSANIEDPIDAKTADSDAQLGK